MRERSSDLLCASGGVYRFKHDADARYPPALASGLGWCPVSLLDTRPATRARRHGLTGVTGQTAHVFAGSRPAGALPVPRPVADTGGRPWGALVRLSGVCKTRSCAQITDR